MLGPYPGVYKDLYSQNYRALYLSDRTASVISSQPGKYIIRAKFIPSTWNPGHTTLICMEDKTRRQIMWEYGYREIW